MAANRPISRYFRPYNANPWNKYIPDCAVRAVSLAINMPYVDVCRKMGVSFKTGHGLIRNTGLYLEMVKSAFDEYFDIVVDFDETLPEGEIPEIDVDTAALFDEEGDMPVNTEINLSEWMLLNKGSGLYVVGLHNPENANEGHLVCASTVTMKFFDTWDCSDYKVDAWMRVKKREA